MKIDVTHREGVTVLAPKGKITIGVGDVALRETVAEALGAGATKILVDLSGVTTIDSSGIGELVAAFTKVKNRDGQVKLAKIPPKVSDILQITQLLQVFEIYDTVEEAIDAF